MSRYSDSDDGFNVGVRYTRRHDVSQPRYFHNDPNQVRSSALIVPPPGGRARGSSRSRSCERRSPIAAPANGPIVINNRVGNNSDSYSDESEDDRRNRSRNHNRRRSSRRRRTREQSYSRSRSRSRSPPRQSFNPAKMAADQAAADQLALTKQKWDLEQARKDLEQMEVTKQAERAAAKEADEREKLKETMDNAAKFRAQKERLERKLAKEEDEKKMEELKANWELEQKREAEEHEAEVQRRREEAKKAVEHYKFEVAQKEKKDQEERDRWEREYKARLQEDLIAAGVDEKDILAILNKEKVADREELKKQEEEEKEKLKSKATADYIEHQQNIHISAQLGRTAQAQQQQSLVHVTEVARPTYTRMSRRHLSFETLAQFNIEYDLDQQDPEYVLIKRWVPEWEQDALWKHTKTVRETRDKVVYHPIEDKPEKHHRHHHHRHLLEPQLEVVRKKKSRSRSRSRSPSPAVMFFAGVRR